MRARVTDIIERTHNVKSFRFARPGNLQFQAGQFMQVTLPVGKEQKSKYFSFSSSPTEKEFIEFTKKMTGSEFSRTLEDVKVGDEVTIKMPMGRFFLNEKQLKHAFLTGGIGITPIRSMLKDAFDRCLPLDLVLFYSNHSTDDIVFRTELEEMAQNYYNLKVVLSLDTTEACPAGWQGKCGFTSADMIREELTDYAERLFYLCGPPAMVASLSEILQGELGVSRQRIKKENFSGY